MNKIFTTPDFKDSQWININTANVGLSEVEILNNECILKYDTLHDLCLYDDTIKFYATYSDIGAHFPLLMLKKINSNRIKSYRACVWYPLIENKIPTSDSRLICIEKNDNFDNFVDTIIVEYPFVRLCTMSTKDICEPIYKRWKDAKNSLILSKRTKATYLKNSCLDCDSIHLFVRKLKKFKWADY